MSFWSYNPINSLGHTPSRYSATFQFPLYPTTYYHHGTHPDVSNQKTLAACPYNRGIMEKMLEWCQKSCKARMSYSEKHGALYFESAEDRALFRVFFDSMNMPKSTHTE
jgi:hypothetical protein